MSVCNGLVVAGLTALPGNWAVWIDTLSQHLIRHAARRAPAALAERLAEEWLADLSARATALSRLRLGIGCCWAARVIAQELCAAKAAAAASGG